jgi:Tfp pilus assembly protein, ATPase PilU
MYCLTDLLDLLIKENAQELRVETGMPPQIVVRGEIRRIDLPVLTTDNVAELFNSFATSEQAEELRRCGDTHFNYVSPRSGRFAAKASIERIGFTLSIKPL